MAIQDDIMAMLSQIPSGGNRATAAGKEGVNMYGRISDFITDEDKMYKARRELGSLYDPIQFGSLEEQMRQDPLTGGGVADIIRKYMDDAGDGVPIPSDLIVDDTRAAERMMEVLPSPNTAPRIPVEINELPVSAPQIPVDVGQLPPPSPRPDFDPETAESLILERDEGLAGLMAGVEPEYGINTPTPVQTEDEYAGTPGTSVGMNPVSDGRIPLKERLFAGQDAAGGPMSGSGQLALASAFIPAAMLPAAAARIGMGAAQIARFLRGGKGGEEALRQVIRQRTGAQMLRDRATGRMIGKNSVGPFKPSVSTPKTSTEATLDAARKFRQNLPQSAFNRGGAVRNNIMNTYGRM